MFKVGDKVKWSSEAGGILREKRGTVARVVVPGEFVGKRDILALGLKTDKVGWGMSRADDSYIVDVGGYAYWPRVKHLEKDDGE